LRNVSPLYAQSLETRMGFAHIAARDADIKLRALQQLYEAIFQPLEKYLQPGRPLIIVPDDVLYYLPFEMLVTKFQAPASPEYLLARYPVAYAYSADMLLERPSVQDGPALRTLLVANPAVGSTNHQAGTGRPLQPLPYTEKEIRRVEDAVK